MPGGKRSRSTHARSGVFISYARDDGEDFARRLRERLHAEEIPLWRDREAMEGGRDWWLQITEALDEVEFMALVITPEALKSDTVRKEWRYARQQGVCVYPIKGTTDLDFDSLPRWMRSAHFYDLEREWQKFVNDLKTRCQTRRVPFMVDDLPEEFVPRPGEFDQLLKRLVDEGREEPVAITAALKGAGGYGKTTLAKALCHDERIQDAFDDGILWVTLGENPGDLTGRVEDLIVTLGDERPNFTMLDAAVNRFKELLADRDILIVIDDVWDRAHLNPFIQGGPRCARLITTRNLDTLPASAARVQVDAMQPSEATALLVASLDHPSDHDVSLTHELTELASRLGKWPLLLRLVNSALLHRVNNEKQSLRDAVRWINKALTKRGLTYFDAGNSDERNRAVERTIGVSLDLLSAQERERYGELAIFPEDIEIPLATLERLWGRTAKFDEFDTEDLCSRLNRFSLLWSYDAERQRIRLHDVVRKFLIDRQSGRLLAVHRQFLDAHRPVVSNSSPWSEMSADEPYLWEHLAHHLIEAKREDELVAAVKDWRYVVTKTLLRRSLAVEADLLAAEKVAGHDEPLRLLRRNFVNSGHLLNRCSSREDIEGALFSRLQHLDDLKPLLANLEQQLKRPYLVPANKLPDLPHPALVRTMSGHVRAVFCCAVSADGTTVVSGSGDKTLKVWDAQTGAERFALKGHRRGVNGCAVSADGGTIVSAAGDRTLKVWDGRSGVKRFTLKGHTRGVTACAVSLDGTIVSASGDNTLKVWDGRIGAEHFTLKGHKSRVTSCALSADGTTIVSASDDGTLKVWDRRSGMERFSLSGHAGPVFGCAVSADGATIVSASQDQTLKIWDGRSGTERFTLTGHAGSVLGCALSADEMTIISASKDRTLKVWNMSNGAQRLSLSGHAGAVWGCAMSTDGATIISASGDRTLKVWDGQTAVEHFTLKGPPGVMRSCAVSADGATIISALNDQTLKVWDGKSWVERFTLSGHADKVTGCTVNADGTTIVSASNDKTLKVWDGRSGAECSTLRGHQGGIRGCAMSAVGGMIVSASNGKTLKVWDGRNGAECFTLRGHTSGVRGCAMSADGSMIVSASNDRTLKVWDGLSGVEVFTLQGHDSVVRDCALSADGGVIVSASDDRTLKIWDGRNGFERFTLRGHTGKVTSCCVSAGGAMVVSASDDQTIKVWDAGTGNCQATLHVDGPLVGCATSADGETIVAVGPRGLYFLRLVR